MHVVLQNKWRCQGVPNTRKYCTDSGCRSKKPGRRGTRNVHTASSSSLSERDPLHVDPEWEYRCNPTKIKPCGATPSRMFWMPRLADSIFVRIVVWHFGKVQMTSNWHLSKTGHEHRSHFGHVFEPRRRLKNCAKLRIALMLACSWTNMACLLCDS